MSKKNQAPEAPVISSLPLPNSDNAMVIDLPDGQKLVVGKMASGTVIEVATWRGTGRPDSRTTRLMLGMTSNDGSAPTQSQENSPVEAKKSYSAIAVGTLNKVVQSVSSSVSGVSGKFKGFKIDRKSISPTLTSPSKSTKSTKQEDLDAQAWLEEILAKSEKKAKAAPAKSSAAKKAPARTTNTRKATAKGKKK